MLNIIQAFITETQVVRCTCTHFVQLFAFSFAGCFKAFVFLLHRHLRGVSLRCATMLHSTHSLFLLNYNFMLFERRVNQVDTSACKIKQCTSHCQLQHHNIPLVEFVTDGDECVCWVRALPNLSFLAQQITIFY